jgi:hypothetical protein
MNHEMVEKVCQWYEDGKITALELADLLLGKVCA